MPFRRLSSHQAPIVGRLHEELRLGKPPDEELCDPGSGPETLYKRVARAKARWLKRVMYGTVATSTEKCFAYAVAEHLNCVTLDAWPGQARLAQLLGFKSAKTIQRAARALDQLSVLEVKCCGRSLFRYAPVFLSADEDENVLAAGQMGSVTKDTDVRESLLLIHTKSAPMKGESDGRNGHRDEREYRRRERGAIEFKVAAMLGSDGMEVLCRLGHVDDEIVERLCRAYVSGALAERELIAARLAAEQLR